MIGRELARVGALSTSEAFQRVLNIEGGNSHAGPRVTATQSLTLPAMFRAIDTLCSNLAMLPFPVFQWTGGGDRQRAPDHPVNALLNRQANRNTAAFMFRKTQHMFTMLWGNGIAEIELNRLLQPSGLWLLAPRSVRIEQDRHTNDVVYHVTRDSGGVDRLPASKVVHVLGLSPDGIRGFGLIDQIARENIGLALAVNQYAQSFFGNSTVLGTAMVAPEPLDPDKKKEIVEAWNAARQGAGKAFGAVLLDGGLDVKHMGQTNESSQTIETLTFSVQDISRWTNVPPPMLMELSNGTFTNTTELGRWYVTYGVGAWLEPIEQEFNRKLFRTDEQDTYFVEMITAGLLRGDAKARGEFYKTMVSTGLMTLNEGRRLENLNGMGPAGDVHYVPLNMTTAERMAAGTDAADRERAGPPGRRSTDEAELRGQIAAAHRVAFDDVFDRMDRIADRAAIRAAKTRTDPVELAAWAEEYFADHATKVRLALAPCAEALGGAIRATFRRTVADDQWDEYVGKFTQRLVADCIDRMHCKVRDCEYVSEDPGLLIAYAAFVPEAVCLFGGSDDGQSN